MNMNFVLPYEFCFLPSKQQAAAAEEEEDDEEGDLLGTSAKGLTLSTAVVFEENPLYSSTNQKEKKKKTKPAWNFFFHTVEVIS
jgi:hypothetical protein